MNELQDLIIFLKCFTINHHSGNPIQAFREKNICGDIMVNIYDNNGITVDYCNEWEYLEIFGISDEYFEELIKRKLIYC